MLRKTSLSFAFIQTTEKHLFYGDESIKHLNSLSATLMLLMHNTNMKKWNFLFSGIQVSNL